MNVGTQFHLRPQQMPEYGGGGGGGRHSGGPRPFRPKELAQIFRLLGEASGRLFSSETRFLLTEESAHDLLTGSFEALAAATENGQLPEIVEQIVKRAGEQRVTATQRMVDTGKDWARLPIFTENEGRDVVKRIKNCLVPRPPI